MCGNVCACVCVCLWQLNGCEIRKGRKVGVTISHNNHRLFVGNIPKNRDGHQLHQDFDKFARKFSKKRNRKCHSQKIKSKPSARSAIRPSITTQTSSSAIIPPHSFFWMIYIWFIFLGTIELYHFMRFKPILIFSKFKSVVKPCDFVNTNYFIFCCFINQQK